MKMELVHLLLDKDFWVNNKHRVKESLFAESDLKALYKVIVKGHEKAETNLKPSDLSALYDVTYPNESRARKANIEILLKELANKEPLTSSIGQEVLHNLWRQDIGTEIANIGLSIAENECDNLSKIKRLLEGVKDDFSPELELEAAPTDFESIMSSFEDNERWLFNIRALRDKIPGVAGGELLILFARPETGKTAAHISLCCSPNGFVHQGAKVRVYVNEEPKRRTMQRALMAATGMNVRELQSNPKLGCKKWKENYTDIRMFDANDLFIEQLDADCERHKPDIIIIDQLDKINVSGNFSRTDEKLREIYTQARDIAKRHECAVIAVSQASADADGKTVLNPTQMEGSKTGKFAEADIIIGIGKHDDYGIDGEQDRTRHLTVGKNKITGWHGTVVCELQHEVSRYVD